MGRDSTSSERRAAAIGALALGCATLLLAVYILVVEFPRGLLVFGCLAVALLAGGYSLFRRGALRLASAAVALSALAGAVLLLVLEGGRGAEAVLIAVGFALSAALAEVAFRRRISLPRVSRPEHPVRFLHATPG